MMLAHEITGEGPTLVLMHGGGHCREAWNAVLDDLRPHRRVVTVDLPGHGQSAPLDNPGPNPLDAMLTEVADFLTHITPPREVVHVAGNSLGGWLALNLAARGQVASATALSPAGFWANRIDEARVVYTLRAMRAGTRLAGDSTEALLRRPFVRALAMSLISAHPSRIPYEDALTSCRSMASDTLLDTKLGGFQLPDTIDTTVPMTIAWGRRDLMAPIYQLRRARAALPHAQFIVVKGVGHVPMTDDPARISEILLHGSSLTNLPGDGH